MFADELYTLRKLSVKLGIPDRELETGLKRSGAKPVRNEKGQLAYTYEAVWEYVHRQLNHQHYAAWGHEADTVTAGELTGEALTTMTEDWPEKTRDRLLQVAKAVKEPERLRFVLRRILRIDPECPACGHFPWIVGYDGRLEKRCGVLEIYVCPSCGYLFLRR